MSRISNNARSVVAVTNPPPIPSGQDTQIITNVNGANQYSYPGYNYSGSDMFTQGQVDVSAIFAGPMGTAKYSGGVLAPNGKIYCAPFSVDSVGIIDPYTNTIDTTTIAGISGPAGRYLGCVLAHNGKVYCIPCNAQNVGIIDPVTNTIDTTTISSTTYSDLSASDKFWGGVLGTDGKIYCVPRKALYIGVIDPVNNTFNSTSITFTSVQSGASNFQYASAAIGRNGNIYFCPFLATKYLRLRTSDNSLNFFGTVPSGFGSGPYYGACCGPDGNVYLTPFNQGNIARIDVSTEDVSSAVTFPGLAGGSRGTSSGAVCGLDGKIYTVPATTDQAGINSNRIFFYDTIANTGGIISTTFAINGSLQKWMGAVLAPNGKIYLIAFEYSHVATIKTGIPLLQPWLLAPEFNKF